MGVSAPAQTVRFGSFEVDLRAGELCKNGIKIKMQEKPFQVLGLLLERRGELVTREELREKLWSADTFVDFDHSLGTAIAKLRQALGDSAHNPRFVETVLSRGYRFLAPIEPFLPTFGRESPRSSRIRRLSLSAASGLLGGALLLVILLGFDIAGTRQWLRRQSNPSIRSLAVLPLENLSGDPAEDYFADGMTDDLITNLAQLGNVQVISRTSVMQYKGTKKPLPQIGRELHVDAVVEGTVVRSGQRVRISAQLVDAATDQHLWARTYERDLRDVLSLQGEVVGAIASEIRIKLTPQARADGRGTPGRSRRASGIPKGPVPAKQRAVSLWRKEEFGVLPAGCPTRSGRRAGLRRLGRVLYLLWDTDQGPAKEIMPKAQAAAENALELNPNLSEAHVALGMILSNYDFDWSGGEREFKRAIELNPSSSHAHQRYSDFLLTTGRINDAISEIRVAQRLDPLSFWINLDVGKTLYVAREYDQALEVLRQAADMNPHQPALYLWMGFAYDKKGMADQCVETELKRSSILGVSEENLRRLREAYKASGRDGYLRTRLELLKQLKRGDNYGIAVIEARLGKKDEAFKALGKAFEEPSTYVSFAKVDPELDSLRSDPRFQELLQRVGLRPQAPKPLYEMRR